MSIGLEVVSRSCGLLKLGPCKCTSAAGFSRGYDRWLFMKPDFLTERGFGRPATLPFFKSSKSFGLAITVDGLKPLLLRERLGAHPRPLSCAE